MISNFKKFVLFIVILSFFLISAKDNDEFLGPSDVKSSPDGQHLYIAQTEANRIDVFSTQTNTTVQSFELNGPPTGLAMGPNGSMLYVTVGVANGTIQIIDLAVTIFFHKFV